MNTPIHEQKVIWMTYSEVWVRASQGINITAGGSLLKLRPLLTICHWCVVLCMLVYVGGMGATVRVSH